MSAAPELQTEVAITDARDHLADLVNRATYAGTPTYLTRRGRRVAAIVPLARAEANEAEARETLVANTCEALWRAVEDSDDETKARVRAAIDELMDAAELDADAKAIRASRAERQAGAKGVSLDDLKTRLGL